MLTLVTTDASCVTIDVYLSTIHRNSIELIVAFASSTLFATERG